MDYKLSAHIKDMLKERNILEEWVWRTLNDLEQENVGIVHNIHYCKDIPENEGRILHVVVNPHVSPRKLVTVFFDRRVRRQK